MYFLKNLACKPDKGELITKDEEKVRQDQAKEKAKQEANRNGIFQSIWNIAETAAINRVAYNFDLPSSFKPGNYTGLETENFDLVIDSMNFGNLGRFFNHRCVYPNLFMQRIVIDKTPYLALFANNCIKSNIVSDQFDEFIGTGSQLTWNYGPQYRNGHIT